ncbi:hypothetical protein K443DRAFT_66570, partial [Laccaria amethystina LaAM-08-1]
GNRATSDEFVPLMPRSSTRFTGRADIISRLKQHFLSDFSHGGFQKRKYFLLHGMGGIGKTQSCLKFIDEVSDCFSFIFWIDASSIGTIAQGLKGICNLPAAQSSGLDGSPESALHWIGLLKDNYIMV